MRTVRIFASDDALILHLGFHKRRAALSKVIKVIKKLTCGHSYLLLCDVLPTLYARFLRLSIAFVKNFDLNAVGVLTGNSLRCLTFFVKIIDNQRK